MGFPWRGDGWLRCVSGWCGIGGNQGSGHWIYEEHAGSGEVQGAESRSGIVSSDAALRS
jgi:hypothetical protein